MGDMKMVGGMAAQTFLSILLFSTTTALQNRETTSTVLTHNATSAKVVSTAASVTAPIPVELSTDTDSPEDGEEDTIVMKAPTSKSDNALIQQEGIVEDEIEREHKEYHWPLWLLIGIWVVVIPVCAMLGLMFFVSIAFVFNGWWQKRTTKMEKLSDDKPNFGKKKMLPEGWAVHLNDEGNIYYVHQASGRSRGNFLRMRDSSQRALHPTSSHDVASPKLIIDG